MTGGLSNDGRTEPKAAAHCSVWVFEDQASHRDIAYEIDPLGAWEKIADSPRAVKFLGGGRCKPKPNIGVIQIALQGAWKLGFVIAQAPKSNNFTFLSSARVRIVAGHGGRALLTHNQGLSQRWARFEAPQKSPS
jgi:hypothetical protein